MKVIDLTHDIHTGMMAYPGDPQITLTEALVHGPQETLRPDFSRRKTSP